MPSIISKRRGARTYYYLVESARVEGKPRIVSQQYLGSGEEVAAKLAGQSAGAPVRSQHKGFGALAAVWSVLERLEVASVVDQVAPRRADVAVTVGTYIALATANRVVAPCSKAAFAAGGSPPPGRGSRRCPSPPWTTAASGRPWTCWARTTWPDRGENWVRRIVDEFGLDLSGLVLDMTNFATFIDSGNDQAPLAQRGKAKQKRVDLRLIGLATGGHPRRRRPGPVPRLPRRPPRRHPVQRRRRRTPGPLPGVDSRRGVPDRGLRRRAELRRQPRARRGGRDRLRRLPATQRPPGPARPAPDLATGRWTRNATPA